MKSLGSLMAACLGVATLVSSAQGSAEPSPTVMLPSPRLLHGRFAHQLPPNRPLTLRAAAIASPAAANITPAVCPEAWATCGYLQVPLDYRQPNGAQIQIYFEQYLHSNPGPAESAILANFGGPGIATTNSERDFAQFVFAPDMDVRDLLLIDDRGTGLSSVLECDELQHGTAPFAQSEIDCAAQLGLAASRYSAGDVAEDVERVRAALGYDQVDYFGASNGGVDATAYATRYPEHVRSLVLDAPLGPPGFNEFKRLQFRTHADPRMVRLVCARSLLCAPDHPDADGEFAQLIASIQGHPVEGNSFDAGGNPVHVRIDEDALLNFVVTYPSGAFTSTGEILAAAAALKAGDAVPLLRLAAEGAFTLVGDSGDPTYYSATDFYATGCAEAGEPWEWSDSIADRKEAYAEAVAGLTEDFFAPFSKAAPTGLLFSTLGRQCLWWQLPTPPTPVVPHHARYPYTPTLVLDGDLDNRNPLEETSQVAALYPNSTNIIVAESGHETVGTSCGRSLIANFIATLQPGDVSCAKTPGLVYAAVGRFPVLAKDARAAQIDPTRVNLAGVAERQAATVAVAAIIDTLQRSLVGPGVGVGLRGGSFQTDFGSTGAWTVTLTNCAFSQDVAVSGTVVWGADNSVSGDVTVSGAGTGGGTLHIEGAWLVPGPVGNFSVTGVLGGKTIAVLVPQA